MTDIANKKTYHIRTFGCQMNERDSETIAGLLEQMGYGRASEKNAADIIVINTCSVRENADHRFFGLLGQTKHIKMKRPETIIAVCGCMMQQAHIVDRIKDKHAWVDLVFGTHNIDRLPELIDEILTARQPTMTVAIEKERAEIIEGLPAKRASDTKAYINIMYGCDNFCTYCIVPYTRGREASRAPDSILSEIKALSAGGTKEITLLGQNVNSYKGVVNDNSGHLDFTGLLETIDRDKDTSGIQRVRFMTSHPKDLSDRLIACFDSSNGLQKLCPSIHLPVQAGSDRVLERMNRRYTKEGYIDLAAKLREANPDIVLTTDFIVGFPGETDEDFEETLDLIERVRFDSAFTFIFSPRVGTPAANYDDQVPEDDKHRRFDRMIERLNAISFEKNNAYVGKTFEVLIDGLANKGDKVLTGRTLGGKLVNFQADSNIVETKPFVNIRITGSNTFSLVGEII